MKKTILFHITAERIRAEMPGYNSIVDHPNQFIYDAKKQTLVQVFFKNTNINQDPPRPLLLNPPQVVGCSFQADDPTSGKFDTLVFSKYVAALNRKDKLYANEIINFDLTIIGYENWSEQRQAQFEYILQSQKGAGRLTINGVDKETPLNKRKLVNLIYGLFGLFLYLFVVSLPNLFRSSFKENFPDIYTALLVENHLSFLNNILFQAIILIPIVIILNFIFRSIMQRLAKKFFPQKFRDLFLKERRID